MTLYRIKIASPQVYVVDTDARVFWPEGYDDNRGALWPRMDPTNPEFAGKVLAPERNAETT